MTEMRRLPRNPSSNQTPVCRRRGGIATIELVMVFPLLAFLGAMIFSLGNAHLQKSSAALQSRRIAWNKRDKSPVPNPVLQLGALTEGRKFDDETRTARMPRMAGLVSEKKARSQNCLFAGNWTDENKAVGFDMILNGIRPHTRPMAQLLQASGDGGLVGGLDSFLTGFNSVLGGVGAVSGVVGAVGNTVLAVSGGVMFATAIAGSILLVPSGGWGYLFGHNGLVGNAGFLMDASFGEKGDFPGD